MPWDDVRAVISERLATDFANKKEELDTHVGNRTYCSDASCSVFIGAEHTTKTSLLALHATKQLAPCARRSDTKATVRLMQLCNRHSFSLRIAAGRDALGAGASSISPSDVITSRTYTCH